MLKADDPKAQLALITGQRAATEQLVGALRQHLANWRTEEGKRKPWKQAFLWSFSEVWTGRVEGVIAGIEQHLASLRSVEQGLAQQATTPAPRKHRARRKSRR